MIKVHTIESFSEGIERIVKKSKGEISYMLATIKHGQELSLDEDQVKLLINFAIKEKIRQEAIEMNLMVNKTSELVFDDD